MPAAFGSTLSFVRDLKYVADEANPNEIMDIIRQLKLGTMFAPLKRVFTGLTAAATYNLTLLDATGETTGVGNPNRLPILLLRALRVTAATTGTVVGTYGLTDIAGTVLTPATNTAMGIARISDDGTALTFASADVTAFTIQYIPRTLTAAQWSTQFPPVT